MGIPTSITMSVDTVAVITESSKEKTISLEVMDFHISSGLGTKNRKDIETNKIAVKRIARIMQNVLKLNFPDKV
ncbi:hypothetical protein ABOONEI_2855 [Aciduliprofundum boonei T469]|nr:hypothetical protein ABOONEI_2855 [Aciduliprofundum boonei T469]